MDFSVDMRCEMKVNRNCELCYQKVTEIMNCLTAVYSVDFLGDNNTVKVEARANPYLIMATIQKYGDHGKITTLHMDGESITPSPGGAFYGQSGYYLPSNAPAYHPYPPPHFLPGNCGYPMPNPPPRPPRQTEAPRGTKIIHHTAPPSCAMQPPPPMPLSSYSYIEPPYWPTSSSSGNCTIM